MDVPAEWAGQSSEDHRATVLLRQEHEMLLDLLRRQHDPALAGSACREHTREQVVALIGVLHRVEDEIFFPALPSEYAALVRAFCSDHQALARCAAGLRRTSDAIGTRVHEERLEQLARDLIVHEEALLFTPLEREHLDLDRSLYDSLVQARARFAVEARAPA